MSNQSAFRAPQAVVAELEVSSATLRRWSDEFADHLSAEASSTQGRSHRRYSDDDLETLHLIKELRDSGLTYDQVRQQLALQLGVESDRTAGIRSQRQMDEEDDPLTPERSEETGLVSSNGGESSALAFFTNTLAALSDNQKSILNSQAANRELLGVLIQDNFNLKEENNQLRERILDVERTLTQVRQEDEWRRESLRQELDAKIVNAQNMAVEAMTVASTTPQVPEIKAVKTKPGCLGAVLGGGDIQIVSLPRRGGRKHKGEGPKAKPAPLSASYSRPAPPQAPKPVHPKPTAPPE